MKENTRQRLIDATYEEVYTHGYQGASLAVILEKAGVHKGSMYHFFANKKEMALAAISEKLAGRFAARYPAEGEGDHLNRFFATLRDLSLRDFRRGCPLANLVQEMSNLDEDFDRTLKALYARFRSVIQEIFDAAIKAGEMKPCDTARLALFTVTVLEGAILSAKASSNAEDYLAAIETLIEYLNSYATSK